MEELTTAADQVNDFVLLALIALVALVVFGRLAYLAWAERRLGRFGYRRKKLLTGNEVDFFHRLRRALGNDYVVLTQVSMAALVETTLSPEHPRFWDERARYSGRIVDYVICHPKTLAPLLVVELDDRMHDFGKDTKRDNFLALAGLQTVRFWSRSKPDTPQLRERLLAALGAAR